MRNLLQDQLLKAGLVKKQQVDATVRAQNRQRDGKAPAPPAAEQVDAKKLLAERAERDRALAAERNALLRAKELQAQVRQLIENHKLSIRGEIDYRFTDDGKIKSIPVNDAARAQLAKGSLVIARHDDSYAILPRAVADQIRERGGIIALDHGQPAAPASPAAADDDYYARFQVPDDLIW